MKRVAAKRRIGRKARARKVLRSSRTKKQYHTMYAYLKENPTGRVCVAQGLCGLGDQIMILPILREIKRKFPKCHLTLAYYRKGKGKSGDIYFEITKHCAWVDAHLDIQAIDPNKFGYVTYTHHGVMEKETNGNPTWSRIDYFASQCGFGSLLDSHPLYHETREEAEWAECFYNSRGLTKAIVLHVDSEEIRRSWPTESSVAFVRLMQKSYPDLKVLVFDFNERYPSWDKEPNVINCSKTTVRQMASLIKRANFFIGPDSGPMHVAASVGCKSAVIFGPIPKNVRIRDYRTHVGVQSDRECCPCWYRSCPFALACLKDIKPERVLALMETQLNWRQDVV